MASLGDRFDQVLHAARDGDDAAWADLYHDLAGPMLGYLRGQRARDPEDLVGEVMLQVVRDLRRFRGDEPGFRAWVFTIAHRRLLDERRRAIRRPTDAVPTEDLEPSLPPSFAEPDALERITTDEVVALLDRLTDDQREVLLLRLLGGLGSGEIAEVTGRDREAVKGLQKRGVAQLRTILGAGSTPPAPEGDAER